jgi:trigger factor
MLVRYGVVNPKNSEVNKINVAPFREGLGKDCEKRVKTSIIVDRIASQEKIEVEDADVDKKVVEIIENTGLPEERIREFLSQGQQLDSVKLDIRRDKVLDFLVARAKVNYQAA